MIRREKAMIVDIGLYIFLWIITITIVLVITRIFDIIFTIRLLMTTTHISITLYLLLKDSLFSGKSLGKRVYGLCVVDKITGKEVTFKLRMLRNVSLIVLFIDIIYYVSKGERIGERMSNTKVIHCIY